MKPFLDGDALAKVLGKLALPFVLYGVCVGQCVLEQGLPASIYIQVNL